MKKRLLCLGLLLVTAFSFSACGGKEKKPVYDTPIVSESEIEEFIENFDRYEDFSDNQLIVMLTKEASFEYIFYDYTVEEFSGIGAVSVKELDGATNATSGLTYKIRQCLTEDPSGSTVPYYLKNYMRTFSITLDKRDKDNVLRAVCILSRRVDVDCAEPNWAIRVDV